MKNLQLQDFPSRTYDKLRYGDTDRQGHVNNAVFASFLETGRVELLYHSERPLLPDGASFVIVSLQLNFIREITWPGKIDIGTGITQIGNSSIKIYQQLFQNEQLVADAETVIVQVDGATGRSRPLEPKAKAILEQLIMQE